MANMYEELTAYITQNQNRYYRLAYSYVKEEQAALDVVQNAVVRALEHVGELRNRDSPMVIVEYKASSIVISQSTFDQIVRYNMVLHARYLIVSNGMNHYCCRIDYDNMSYDFLKEVPDYADLEPIRQ